MNKTIIGLLSVFAFIGWTETALAESYTGCVTPGGTITHLAIGESPLKSCNKKSHVIHLHSAVANQHSEAHYNQAAMCKALHELELSNANLTALGCHTEPTSCAPGVLGRVYAYNVDMPEFPLQIKQDLKRWGPGYHWVLNADKGGAFVAHTTQIISDSKGVENCKAVCDGDSQCIAAFYDNPLTSDTLLRDCRTFHYSDTMKHTWNEYCSPFDGPLGCKSKFDGTAVWFVRVGGDVSHCPL